ncbi:MAG: iron-containing alcohol dehydrogenase [Alphaproteobacteria bacterium]|nr:MAG: iron-containing alcohol dehydrogenase [Alphaproteobacteria bacterium]
MTQAGQVVFSKMEEVVWGKPAADTVAALAQKRGAERVFLMVSGTLNRTTDEIDKLRLALGNKCVGTFDKMPPHTPRSAVIAAAEQARAARSKCRSGGPRR